MADKSVLIMPGEVTGAQAQMMANALGRRSGNGGRKRRKRGAASSRPRKRRRKNSTSRKSGGRSRSRGTARLVKGSAAAKRHMAKLRRMRK